MVSSSNKVISEIILSEFPYPMSDISEPFFNRWAARKFVYIP